MRITAYSLAMAVIWTTVFGILICIVQTGKKTIQYFGINSILILYGLCIVRLLVPVELPQTKVIPVEKVYNAVTRFCIKPVISDIIKAGNIILIVWGCGTVIKLFGVVKDRRIIRRMLRDLPEQTGGMAYKILKRLQKESADERKISVYITPFAEPMEVGIIHPAVLLPDREYTEQDLYFIIRHEYVHILNHDTAIKLLMNLWRCIFWWNPIVYIINDNMENAMELKCDLLTAGIYNQKIKADYLSMLLHVINDAGGDSKSSFPSKNSNFLFKAHEQAKMKKRFRCVSECPEMTQVMRKRNMIYFAGVLLVCVTLFLASYSFVLQSQFEVPVLEEGKDWIDTVIIDYNTVFLEKREEGYAVIYENQCIEIIDKEVALWMQEQGFEIR